MELDVHRSTTDETQRVCQWSFEVLDPNHSDPSCREFLICQGCGSSYVRKYIDGNPCTQCGGSAFEPLKLNSSKPGAVPERIANDGSFAGIRSLLDKPVGVNCSTLSLDMSEKKVQIVNNHPHPLMITNVDFPMWVCHDAPPQIRGVPLSPGESFELVFWGHLLRDHQREFGHIHFKEVNNIPKPPGHPDDEKSISVRLGVQSALKYSIVGLTVFMAVALFFLSTIYLTFSMWVYEEPREGEFWYHFMRYSMFSSLTIFMCFFLATGLIRKGLNSVRKLIGESLYGWGLIVLEILEKRPWGVLFRLILFALVWVLVWSLSLFGVFLLNSIGMTSNWFFILLSTLVYLAGGLILIDLWFENYRVHVLSRGWFWTRTAVSATRNTISKKK